MLSGSFITVYVSRATAPAPCASLRRPWPTRRRSRRACEGSLRTVPCRGSSCTRCCTEKRYPQPVRRPCRSCVELGCQGPRRPRGRLAPELLADELAGPQELHQVDARFYSQTVEHVDHVFSRDVARSALGVGAAAEARHRAVESSHTRLERRVNVRKRLPVGVVVMTAELGHRDLFCDGLDHRADASRRSDADRVAERDLVAAHLVELFRQRGDRLRLHVAFVGASRRAGNVAAHAHFAFPRGLDDRGEALEALRDAAVDVLPAERFGSGAEYGDLLRARCARRFEALQVRNEHRVGHARLPAQAGHDLRAVGHLRNPFRGYEGGRLDRRQPRFGEAMDELDLDLGRDPLRFVLQAIPWAYIDDSHLPREAHGAASFPETSNSINSAPSPTCSPTRQKMRAIRPRAGARMVCSIFIASSISRGASFSTPSPAATKIAMILPGIGARKSPARDSTASS